MRNPTIDIRDVLNLIRPNAECVLIDNDYDQLDWHDTTQSKPTMAEIEDGAIQLAALAYRRQRAVEYPPIGDFADAYVHAQNGDPSKLAAYVQACNAVKAKYPKS